MYDVIGDVHGQADKLKQLLLKLGYIHTEKGFAHPSRKAIFVGDIIDRGLQQLDTLNLIRTMVDNNNALIVLGNHEFNLIGWATLNKSVKSPNNNSFLRSHSLSHNKQHSAFFEQIGSTGKEFDYWINWFKSLPVFLDLDNIRVVHASWHQDTVDKIKPYLDENNCLYSESIQMAFNGKHPLFYLCQTLLKGQEYPLPNRLFYFDKKGRKRSQSRIKWWLEKAPTLNDFFIIPDEERIDALKRKMRFRFQVYQGKKPVFFGHYCLTGNPKILTQKIACVDYPYVTEQHELVAYRWQGESELNSSHFIY